MTINHDAIAAMVRCDITLGLNICAAYLDLYDEVKRLRANLHHVIQERDATFALMLARAEKAKAERERLLYVLDGVAGAIDTGRNEPLQVWRDQINIARATLKGDSDE